MRLDKYLCDADIGTRSEVKKIIKAGRVKINDEVVKKPETKVLSEDIVLVDNMTVSYQEFYYYMLNKPSGVVSATNDNLHKTVCDLFNDNLAKKLFPVGRLDIDTEGLLIMTNDGDFSHNMLSPKKGVMKTYFAKVKGHVTEEDIVLFEKGLDIKDDKPTLPAKLEIINAGDISECFITVQEGRFHEVKRMFLAVGKEVIYLKRMKMGELVLDEKLEPGEYRELTKEELLYVDKCKSSTV